MPATKVTLLFNAGTVDSDGNAARSAGFSESVYSSYSVGTENLSAAIARLCNARAALLPKNVRIIGQRTQTVDPNGATISYDKVFVGSSTAQNDLPQTALQWTVRSFDSPNSRSYILRGMPDARIVTGEYAPSAGFNAALIAYFSELATEWKFRAITRTILPAKIVSISLIGLMTTVTPHGLAEGDLVNIMSTRGDDRAKESYQAYVVGVGSPTVATLTKKGTQNFTHSTEGGRVRKATIIYPSFSITNEEVLSPTAITRKAGGPFKKFRGRQTARKS